MPQEDLTVKDVEDILSDLKAGRTPAPGPRLVVLHGCAFDAAGHVSIDTLV